MHSFDWNATGDRSDPPDLTMHHNGDFSGDVLFVLPRSALRESHTMTGQIQVAIPFEAIKMLVADYVYGERMSALESMGGDPDQILGVGSGQ